MAAIAYPAHSVSSTATGWRTYFSAGVLGTGLALTSATQLRVGGTLGPSEVILGCWVFGTLALTLLRGRLHPSPLLRGFAVFWVVSLACLFTGWTMGLVSQAWEVAPGHDVEALLLSAALSLLLLSVPNSSHVIEHTIDVFLVALVVPMLALLALGVAGHVLSVGRVNAWTGIRFTGWAVNPNQLSLACASVPFLAVARAYTKTGARRYVLFALGAGGAIIGVSTASDALNLAWGLGGALLVFWWGHRFTSARGAGFTRRFTSVLLVPLILAGSMVTLGRTALQWSDRRGAQVYDEGGQGVERVIRWRAGVLAWERSPVFGLGPGSYAGRGEPFQGSEAHNTPIDWAMSTGAVGLLSLVALGAWLLGRAAMQGEALNVIGLASLGSFALFHYVMRHPAFWFALMAFGTLAYRRDERRPGVRGWRPGLSDVRH